MVHIGARAQHAFPSQVTAAGGLHRSSLIGPEPKWVLAVRRSAVEGEPEEASHRPPKSPVHGAGNAKTTA